MTSNLGLLYALESISETGKFFHAVYHKIGDGKIPAGQDAEALALLLGLRIPDELRGATITPSDDHEEPEPNALTISMTFPAEEAEARTAPKQIGCYTYCKSGPFGIGQVCIKVCANCTFKKTSFSCTLTETISGRL